MSENTPHTNSATSGESTRGAKKRASSWSSGRPPAETGSGFRLALIWHSLRLWWKVATPAGLILATIAGIVVWYTFVPVYRAKRYIVIRHDRAYIAYAGGGGEKAVRREIDHLRSPAVAQNVVEDVIEEVPILQGQLNAAEWVRTRISVHPLGSASEWFEVAFTCADPVASAKILNSVVENYQIFRDEQSQTRRSEVMRRIRDELDNRTKDLMAKQKDYKDRLKGTAIPIPETMSAEERQNYVRRTTFGGLSEQLLQVAMEEEVVTLNIAMLEGDLSKRVEDIEVTDADVEPVLNDHPEIRSLLAQIQDLEQQIIANKSASALNFAKIIRQKETLLGDAREKLESRKAELRPQVKEEVKQTYLDNWQRSLEQLKAQKQELTAKRKLLDTKMEDYKANLQLLSEGQVDLSFEKENLAMARDIVRRINERKMIFEIEEHAPDMVHFLDPAEVPTRPVEASPLKRIAMASMIAFVFPFGLATLWEHFVRRVSDAKQLVEESHVPVVGEIAHLPVRRVFGGVRSEEKLQRDRSIFEESIDSLRTTLLLSDDLEDMRVLAIVSPVSGEGKTSLSSQLAVSLARSSERPILLIDGDLRSPDMHDIFDVPLEPGLTDVLNGTCDHRDAIVTSISDNLHVLPAGDLEMNPHKLFNNGVLQHILGELREEYQYIIIDTPPVLSASESLVVAKAADGALICTMREVSRTAQVRSAHMRLVAAGAHPAGVVFNGVPTKHYSRSYGAYSYSMFTDA